MSARKHPDRDRGPGDGWHASPALLAAYAAGRAGPSDSWSLEMHLVACEMCRAELALVLPAGDRAELARVRAQVVVAAANAPRPVPARGPQARRASGRLGLRAGGTWWGQVRLVLRPSSLVVVLVAVLLAVGLDRLAGLGATPGQGAAGGVLWLLAPALPLVGVALCSVREGDPWGEAVLATPSAGLRLTLWRTVVVLVVAVPAAAGLGVVLGGPQPALWLLPCLTLTALALLGGTVVPLERAAALLAGAWVVLVLSPALLAGGRLAAVRSLAASAVDSPVVDPAAQVVWAAAAITAAMLLVHRRYAYEHLTPTRRARGAL